MIQPNPQAQAQAQTPNLPIGRPSRGEQFSADMGRAAEKRGRSRNLRPLAALGPYLWHRRVDVMLALLFLLLAAGTTLALPLAARALIDHGLSDGNVAAVDRHFQLLGAIAAGMAVFSAARYFYVTKIGERVVADLRADVYDRVIGLSPRFFQRFSTGEALSRLTADAQVIETLVASSASIALRNILTALGGLSLLLYTSPKLAGILLLIVPAAMIPLFAIGRSVRSLSVGAQDRLADANSAAAEALDAVETVQAFGREDASRKRYRDWLNAAFGLSLKRMRMRAFMTAGIILLVFGGIALVLWFGARAVLAHEMSAGALAQFIFLSVMTAGAAAALAEAWGDVQKAAGATERLMDLLAQQPDIAAPLNPMALPQPAQGAIAIEHVHFAYPGADGRSSLRDFSLSVRPGETVALVGPSGAGKSTVFRLLLRFYDADSGHVRLDGVSAPEADPREWRKRFAYVAQDAALFSGNARENILFGRAEATPEQVLAAARAAEAEPFILARAHGYDEELGPRAKLLSGGERQRLALARALVRNAPVLLLDEATSALDAENERLVQKAIEAARAGRTTLIIAHRLATVLRADRIVVMDAGRIVEEGTHTDLLARNGLYARLAKLQFTQDGTMTA